MKIYYNSKLAKWLTVLNNTDVVMFFGTVHTENATISEKTKCHEGVHIFQYWTCFWLWIVIGIILMFALEFALWSICALPIAFIFYYILYFGEALISLAYHRLIKREGKEISFKKCYMNNAFEQEAYNLENEYLKPCGERRTPYTCSFMKHYGKI